MQQNVPQLIRIKTLQTTIHSRNLLAPLIVDRQPLCLLRPFQRTFGHRPSNLAPFFSNETARTARKDLLVVELNMKISFPNEDWQVGTSHLLPLRSLARCSLWKALTSWYVSFTPSSLACSLFVRCSLAHSLATCLLVGCLPAIWQLAHSLAACPLIGSFPAHWQHARSLAACSLFDCLACSLFVIVTHSCHMGL